MSKLLELPTELRHQILLEALPLSTTVVPSPESSIGILKRVCKQLYGDLNTLDSQYAPTYIVSEPTQLKYIRPRSGIDQMKQISLHIFSTAKLEHLLRRTHSALDLQAALIGALLLQWDDLFRASRPRFPKQGLQTISLDISPIPGYARDHSTAFIAWLVNHPNISNQMFNVYENLLGAIIQSIGVWVQTSAGRQQPLLKVVGTLSCKTRTRMPSVYTELEKYPKWGGLDAVFEVNFVEDLENLKWEHILEILQHKYERIPHEVHKEKRKIVKDRLRKAFQEDKQFRSLFNKNAVRDPILTRDVMLEVAEMASGARDEELTYGSLIPLLRALIYQTADRMELLIEAEDSSSPNDVVEKRLHIRQRSS